MINKLAFIRVVMNNKILAIGMITVMFVASIGLVGPVFVDVSKSRPASVVPNLPPSWENPLGTESAGRDVLAVMVAGTPQTLKLGLLAGSVAILVGTALGFIAGYYGGVVDTLIRGAADVLLTIPILAVLIIIAASVRLLSVEQMALVVAALSWMWPTRTIRAQVLTLRERAYVDVARLSGQSDIEIIVRELIPNLFPFLAAAFVGATASAILAALGLEALGLGAVHIPTLGMSIYWVIWYGGLIRGMWWWWGPPILIIVLLFIGLFLISAGLDQIANPRLRRSV